MIVMEDLEIRIRYYSSKYKIFFVGEGDFFFLLCLVLVFGLVINIIVILFDLEGIY